MDFYVVLGLEPGATTADIKRAYRRLARRYHPGINPGDRAAEAIFQRISEAYETLVDPGRRQQYDAGGGQPGGVRRQSEAFAFTEFDFSMTAQGTHASTFSELFADVLHPVRSGGLGKPEAGADLHATLTVEFVDALRGVERQVVVTRQVSCNACGGRGQVTTREGRCSQCQGSGSLRWARGHMVFSKSCPGCGGTGRQNVHTCPTCSGQGGTVRSEGVPVAIPAGATDGTRLRLPDRGHAGRNGGRTGDLYVTLHVQPHPRFRRDGDDLLCDVPVALHEAVLGARVELPSFDGPVKLRIPPGTQSGQRFRLSGRGSPTLNGLRGDLVIEVRVVLPQTIDERSKELIREFGQRNHEDVRRRLSGSD